MFLILQLGTKGICEVGGARCGGVHIWWQKWNIGVMQPDYICTNFDEVIIIMQI